MKELVYQVEFKSDIVLPATSNTEGNIEQLDFIPGSNFLGMVASRYSEFKNSFDIFHSGKVKFGDATILKDGKQTYKMPLSYFYEKLDDDIIYNHHLIEDFLKFNQLKQKRNGFITSNKKVVDIEYSYAQKSGYDSKARRSKDGSMYGYNAIVSGAKWQFSIKCDDSISDNDIKLIQSTIIGQKRLGKSKSAQYGLVEIQECGVNENIEDKSTNELILYANSRLALVDESGNPTLDLKYLFDGLEDHNIDYEKTQIRTSTFTPFNGARKTKDYERVCINKGSVIVLKNIYKNAIPNYVGGFQSEGFGDILINPSFTMNKDGFKLEKDTKNIQSKNQNKIITEKFEEIAVQFLVNRHNAKIEKLNLANDVATFIKNNKSKYQQSMNSQWGTIRSICSKCNDSNIKDEVEQYTSKGVAKEKWSDGKKSILIEAIANHTQPLLFTKLLSIQMPKVKNTDQKRGK